MFSEGAISYRKLLGNCTELVGLFLHGRQPMLRTWNVPTMCPPIEQEPVESARLLLLASRSGYDGGGQRSRSVAQRESPSKLSSSISRRLSDEIGIVAGFVFGTTQRSV